MAKQLRIEDPDLARRAADAEVILIGDRSFVLVRPRLRGAEVDEYLSRRRLAYPQGNHLRP